MSTTSPVERATDSQAQPVDIAAIVLAIRRVLPAGPREFALHQPLFAGNEWTYLKECLDSGWVSSGGQFVGRFEQMLVDLTGAAAAVAVVNGTSALHLCLRLVGTGRGDEVLMPALTFVATANAAAYCGAVPHFVDCEEGTLGLDARKLAEYLRDIAQIREGCCINRFTGARIAAVVPMHTFGHPVDMDALAEGCAPFGLPVVEDAAQALGSYYKGKHTGTLGRLGALSFNGNKIVTTGGGGAVLTNDISLGKMAKHVSTTARLTHPWHFSHDEVGYNYRLPNINAALGCAQLEQLPQFLAAKRKLSERYMQEFQGFPGMRFIREPDYGQSNYWLNSMMLDRDVSGWRDRLLEATNQQGIGTRPVWVLLHKLPMFAACPRMDLSVAESVEARLVNLPSSPMLGMDCV